MPDWLIALLPLIGLIAGYLLQSWLSRGQTLAAERRAKRTEVYADYLRAQSEFAMRLDDDPRDHELGVSLASVRNQMAVYASRQVLQAQAEFVEAVHLGLDEPVARESYLHLCQMMREDSLPEVEIVSDAEMYMVIYGSVR